MRKRRAVFLSVLCAVFSFLLPLSQAFAYTYVGPIATSRTLTVDNESYTSIPLSDSSSVYVKSGQWLRLKVDSYGNDSVYVKVTSGGKTLYSGYVYIDEDVYLGAPVGEAKIYMSCSWLDDFCYATGNLGTYYRQ